MEAASKADIRRLEQMLAKVLERLPNRAANGEWMGLPDYAKRRRMKRTSSIYNHVKLYPEVYVMGDTLRIVAGQKEVRYEECERRLQQVPALVRNPNGRPKKTDVQR